MPHRTTPPLVAAQEYQVSFAYAQFNGAPNAQALTVTINTGSIPLATQMFTDPTPTMDIATGWERATFTFVSDGMDTGITFGDADPSSTLMPAAVMLIDDASITQIPEPASTSLVALAGLALLRRRRK